jgi:FkbH-like protein
MKETLPADRARARLDLPKGFGVVEGLKARSQIVWAEHCSECAYPACYSSCAFYSPRGDLHCRRFEAGIEGVVGQPAAMRVRFRKWGKLEGRGPAVLHPVSAANRMEMVDALIGDALARTPYAVGRTLGWRWNDKKSARLFQPTGIAPEALVIESFAPDGRTHPFTVSILPEGHAGGMFQATFEVGPEHRRLVVAAEKITALVDLSKPFLIQVEPVGEAAGRDVVFGLMDFMSFENGVLPASLGGAPASASPAPKAKVVVWDLDETLWHGTLAETGAAGVTPRPEAIAAIKALDARGVLQSIASKNDLKEALAALEGFGLAEYFLHPQVHWSPKSGSVAEIARRLDLGLDSFVFVDDQPFERAEVQASHPTVRVLAHTEVAAMLEHPWFDLPATPESAKRRLMYREEAERTAAFEAAPTDYLGFLRASGLTLDVRRLAEADIERTHELSQRTNQLNFTGAKLTREEVVALAAAEGAMTLRCADRFGDYGLIGFAALDLDAGRLDQFFMSCRVQRKRVEHAAFALMAEQLKARGHTEFLVTFKSTARNKAGAELLADLGFTETEGGYTRPLALPFADADIVRLAAIEARAA